MDLSKLLTVAKNASSYKASNLNPAKRHSICRKYIYIARERGTSYCKIGLTWSLEQRMKALNVASYGGFKVIASQEFIGNCFVLESELKNWFVRAGAQHGEGTEMFVFTNGSDAEIRQIFNLVVAKNVTKLEKMFPIEKVTKAMSRQQDLNLLQA